MSQLGFAFIQESNKIWHTYDSTREEENINFLLP